MTIIVWDGKKLAADKRGFDRIEFPYKEHYGPEEARELIDYLGPERGLIKLILNETGPVRKIIAPKDAYFRNSKIRAIGASGDLSVLKALAVKQETDLSFFDSLLYTNKNSYLVVTENFIAKIDNKENLLSRTMIYPKDVIVTCGGSEFNYLDGHKLDLTAEQLINFAAMSDYACGLGIDVINGAGSKTIKTIPINPISPKDLKHFYDTILNTVSKNKRKELKDVD